MNSTFEIFPCQEADEKSHSRVARQDVEAVVVPVSRRYRQITRRLEQIERQLERIAALDLPAADFGVVGVPEDAAEMTSMHS